MFKRSRLLTFIAITNLDKFRPIEPKCTKKRNKVPFRANLGIYGPKSAMFDTNGR